MAEALLRDGIQTRFVVVPRACCGWPRQIRSLRPKMIFCRPIREVCWHLDLKPSNVLMDQRGVPRITDFGLAKRVGDSEVADLTFTGQALGTAVGGLDWDAGYDCPY